MIVPYGKERKLIEKLGNRSYALRGNHSLKEVQQYSVNLYEHIFKRLDGEQALYSLGETGVIILKDEYYDPWAGIKITPQEMIELIV